MRGRARIDFGASLTYAARTIDNRYLARENPNSEEGTSEERNEGARASAPARSGLSGTACVTYDH